MQSPNGLRLKGRESLTQRHYYLNCVEIQSHKMIKFSRQKVIVSKH